MTNVADEKYSLQIRVMPIVSFDTHILLTRTVTVAIVKERRKHGY